MRSNLIATLSIVLSDPLARESQKAAKRLGISRTQFIRVAIAHELAQVKQTLEQAEMIQCFSAMKQNETYLQEVEKIDHEFAADLPDDSEEWWTEK